MQKDAPSPRDQYLAIQKQVEEDNAKTSGLPTVTEEEVDEIEREIDKSMGDEKFTVTAEEYEAGKEDKVQAETLHRVQEYVKRGKHLNNQQRALLNSVLANREDIQNPVLIHLLAERVKQHAKFEETGKHVAELNKKIMQELTKASQDLMKVQGTMEHLDNQILDYVEKNPDSVIK